MSTSSFSPEKRYLFVARRWLWLLILAPIIASAIGYSVFKDESPTYEAESQLLIGPGMDTPFQDINTLRASEHVMQTYKKMAYTDSFLQSVANELDQEDMSTGEIRSLIDIQPDPASLLMTINVQSAKPDLSVHLANAIANAMVRMSPTNEGNSAALLKADNQVQASNLADSIKQTEARLAALEATLVKLNSESTTGNSPLSSGLKNAQAEVNQQESHFVSLGSVAEQSQTGAQIMQAFIENTLARIQQLETRLAATDPILQPAVIAQITDERAHLSNLQKSVVELQTRVEDQSLDQYFLTLNTSIKAIQEKINVTSSYDITNKRLLYDRLDQERGRLTDAEKIASDRRQMVLDRISDERKRLSDIQSLPAQERLFISDQIASERNHLDNLQQSYATLNDALFKASTNQAQVAQLATKANQVPSNLRLVVLMAGIAGLAAAVAFVLVYGYFDKSIYTTGDLEALIGFPTLGKLHKSAAGMKRSALLAPSERLIAHSKPYSPLAEDYRKIVARLASETPASQHADGLNILVTSLSDQDVAGEAAANLAVTLAQTGQTVILVDANLHQPVIANLFEINSEKGFTSNVVNPRNPIEAKQVSWLSNLSVMPSGPIPHHPFGVIASENTAQLFRLLKEHAAYVLISGAPITHADMLILAKQVDGVILVVPDKNMNRAKVEELVETARANHWNVLGTILLHQGAKVSNPVKESHPELKPGPLPHSNNGKLLGKDAEIAQFTTTKH